MREIVKGLMSLNLAALIRLVRFGPKDAWRRLAVSYYQIDPFGDRQSNQCTTQRNECKIEMSLIPEVTLSAVVCGRPTIRIDSTYSYVDGSLPWCDIVPLLAVLVDRAPKAVLEIGTFNGHTTRLFALNLPSSTIHTVDLPTNFSTESDVSPLKKDDFQLIMGRSVGNEYRSDPSISNVVQHFGDTATWNFRNAQGATFFFIDGSHTYEYARNDTEKALAACSGHNTTFIWHDCDEFHPGVVRWLRDMTAAGHTVRRIAGTHLAIMDASPS
jgi:hypothetical protein